MVNNYRRVALTGITILAVMALASCPLLNPDNLTPRQVNYFANGADVGEPPVDPRDYFRGDTATVLGNSGGLSLVGHTFGGWNTQADGTGSTYQVGDLLVIDTSDIGLHALWINDGNGPFTISFDPNGATSGSSPVDNGEYFTGDQITLPDPGDLAKIGEVFAEWNTEPDGSGTGYAVGEDFTFSDGSVTFYAQWEVPLVLDLVVANFANAIPSGRNRTALGTGTGTFQAPTDVSTDQINNGDVVLADFNNDGNMDAFFSGYSGPERIHLGDGAGGFAAGANASTMNRVGGQQMRAADLNSDGNMDVVVAFLGTAVRALVYLGDGDGGFTHADLSTDTANQRGIAIADFNNDDILDVVVTAWGTKDRIYLGNGDGTFGSGNDVSTDSLLSTQADAADLNGDGNMDLLINVSGAANRVYLGDGTGSFTGSDLSADSESSYGLGIADFDGDGTLDIVVGNVASPNQLFVGNGDGTFAAGVDMAATDRQSFDLAVGDLDGDGDQDVFVVNFQARNTVYLNNGSGMFSSSDASTDTFESYGVALADLDGN